MWKVEQRYDGKAYDDWDCPRCPLVHAPDQECFDAFRDYCTTFPDFRKDVVGILSAMAARLDEILSS